MESTLVRVQHVVAEALAHPNQYFGESGSRNSMGCANTVDSMLLRAEEMLKQASTLSQSDIPRRPSSPNSLRSIRRQPTSGFTYGRGSRGEGFAQSESCVRTKAIVSIQAIVRRHPAKRKLAWKRILHDFMITKRKLEWTQILRELMKTVEMRALPPVQSTAPVGSTASVQSTAPVGSTASGRSTAPVRSTVKNHRSDLATFFGPWLAERVKDHNQEPETPEAPSLTKREATNLRLRRRRKPIVVTGDDSRKMKDGRDRIKNARDYAREAPVQEKRLSLQTTATATSSTMGTSTNASTLTPSTSRNRLCHDDEEARWASPFLSPSPSQQSLSSSRHSRRSSISTAGQPQPLFLSPSASSSSLDTSHGMSTGTRRSSGRPPVRFIESQNSLESVNSFWSAATYEDGYSSGRGAGRDVVADPGHDLDFRVASRSATVERPPAGTTNSWWNLNNDVENEPERAEPPRGGGSETITRGAAPATSVATGLPSTDGRWDPGRWRLVTTDLARPRQAQSFDSPETGTHVCGRVRERDGPSLGPTSAECTCPLCLTSAHDAAFDGPGWLSRK
jgi:hypothetical protein